jgi:sulfite reductase (NADPH) hemoprotein beta-component
MAPPPATRPAWTPQAEPLVRMADADELREALAKFRAGEWDEETWTAFRLRRGIYGQLQPGVQMVRIKVPGGVLPFGWARTVAAANRKWAKGDIHVTTRQAFQIYHVPTDDTPDLLADLAAGAMTSREACGNTLRNFTACPFAGVCPKEHTDAGKVAAQLAESWIRHPLVQNMPRKFKSTVSGCTVDCGAGGIHDLGLIAIEKDGQQGFRVLAGGGTGGQPVAAVEVADFVTEEQLPAVVEALVRLHQKYSDRVNRNKARLKFVLKRFGEATFRKLFTQEFERALAMPQRPWTPVDWRDPDAAGAPTTPAGVFTQHDGKTSIVVSPTLGLMSADQLDGLATIGELYGADHMRTTRDQNIAFIGIDPADVEEAVGAIRAIGLPVQDAVGDEPDLVSCPGTTTCRIGITNSQDFGRELTEIARNYAPKPNLTVRISGCQNGCGLHHVADFGFRGMGKKIDGQNAPHYQIYVGGSDREAGGIGIGGPVVPARQARRAFELLLAAYAPSGDAGTPVRDWAEATGKEGLRAILAPLGEAVVDRESDTGALYVDWGKSQAFTTPVATQAECAAGFPLDTLYQNLADDGLINVDRALHAGLKDRVLDDGRNAAGHAAQRLLGRLGQEVRDDELAEVTFARVSTGYATDHPLLETLDAVRDAESAARVANGNADLEGYREALALWLDTVEELVGRPVALEPPEPIGRLGDSDGAVSALIGGAAE